MTEAIQAPAPVDALLADGRVAVVRLLRPEDRDLLRALHGGLSEDNRRRRFFSAGTHAGEEYADHLCAGDPSVIAVVATLDQELIGVASAERNGPDVAEVALVVADLLHGVGVGTLLLEHVSAACRERGITRLTAEVLVDNQEMIRVLMDAGIDLTRTVDSGVVHVEMSTAATARAVEAADEREGRAEARSLAPLLDPRSVVVVGVRRDGSGAGAAVLQAIREGGFTGRLAVVHPDQAQIQGIPAHPSLATVPGPIDLVVIAVPAAAVERVLIDAVAAAARSAVVISAGFGELGAAGLASQERILRLVRSHSLRLVGPNCLGLLTNTPDTRLNATFGRALPETGGLALASQSGGVGIVILDQAMRTGVGVRAFVSLGNKLDVSGNDLLSAWYDDSSVTMAGLYLESFGNPRKFLRLARRFSARKPLLAVRAASSASGRRAGAAHTAAVAGSAVGVEALFTQAGVIGCDDAEELAHTALVLDHEPLPGGHRVGILTNAAGLGVLAADAAEQRGLTVPRLSRALRQRLCAIAPDAAPENPVDVGAGPTPGQLAAARAALVGSGEIDSLLTVLIDTRITESDRLLEALADPAAPKGIPEVVVPLGGTPPRATTLTTLPSIASAVGALSRLADYADWRRSGLDEEPEAPDPARAFAVRQSATLLLPSMTSSGVSPRDQRELLDPYGLAPIAFHAPLDAVDLTLRLSTDPALGRLITVSYAGTRSDLWRESLVLVPPVSRRDAHAAARRLRTWPLLDGEGGRPPLDTAAAERLLMALSGLAVEVPQIVELELDPVCVTAAGPAVGAARVLLSPAAESDNDARHLTG